MKYWSIICAWLGVAFAAEAMGLFAHELNAAAAIILLISSGILWSGSSVATVAVGESTTSNQQSQPSASFPIIGLVVCVVGLLMVPNHWTIRLFGAALWFWGLDIIARKRTGQSSHFAAFAVATMVFGTFQYLYGNSLTSWYFAQGVSDFLSGIARSGSGGSTFGPTFSGIGLASFALLIVLFATILPSHRKFNLWGAFTAAAIVVVYVAYLGIFAHTQPEPKIITSDTATWQQQIWRFVHPLRMTGLLAVGLCFPIAIYFKGISGVNVERTSAKRGPWDVGLAWLAVPMVAIGVVLFVNTPGEQRTGKGVAGTIRYALYKEGFHNWMVPNKQRYGSRSAGMFGNLPRMLDSMGWEGNMIESLDDSALADRDVLFIANPKDHLDAETIARIENFVESGGSLLMLGDHTWRKDDEPGGDKILDEAIQNTSISFNFDSAYYYIGGWLHSLQYWAHSSTVHLRDETNESGCVVGASLDIEYPATPLIIGRYGYADKGLHVRNPQKGYMHDGMPDPDERLGDMVLVAAQNVGKGRVIVVGDTSGFVNAIQTQTWRFTSRVFDWLASSGKATVARWRDVLGIILLFSAMGLIVRGTRLQAPMVPVACAAMLISGWGAREYLAANSKPTPLTGQVALVDLSHVGLHSMEAWRDDAISGIYLNLMREGYFSLGARDFDEDQLLASDLFVTIAPSKPFSSSEIDALDRFMNRGGSVLLSVGWEEKAGASSLLDYYGMDIAYKPQGRATNAIPGTTIMPNYWEVWPVLSGLDGGPPAETIAELRGDPTIVRRPVGAGQLVVIGDTKIFHCRNFETEEGAVMPNVQFFRWLVNNILKQGAI
ncbi:MAG: hypothetical protein DHS20C16_34690 [Phycisphaerae bacterium]|nr:MAG: hypothetical protein DHS20C16_34690 [Phycisphaerae bacterium]